MITFVTAINFHRSLIYKLRHDRFSKNSFKIYSKLIDKNLLVLFLYFSSYFYLMLVIIFQFRTRTEIHNVVFMHHNFLSNLNILIHANLIVAYINVPRLKMLFIFFIFQIGILNYNIYHGSSNSSFKYKFMYIG